LVVIHSEADPRANRAPELAARFGEFADVCARFSQEIVERGGVPAMATKADRARLNMQVARAVFGKWSIEILAVLYAGRDARFQEIKKAVGDISARVLSVKLARLERLGLVRRTVLDTHPPSVQYSLTERGMEVSKLGEPVFLYLQLTEGFSSEG
jgi:DNA-binding HxlR family transcriptional regulator